MAHPTPQQIIEQKIKLVEQTIRLMVADHNYCNQDCPLTYDEVIRYLGSKLPKRLPIYTKINGINQ